jgi:hypothetical protein
MTNQDDVSGQPKAEEDVQVHPVDWAPRKPYAGLISSIAWAGVVAGIAGFALGSNEGWMGSGSGYFFLLCAGGLVAFVFGIVTVKRGLRFQGALQIIGGLILLALPVLLIVALAAAYSSMAHG